MSERKKLVAGNWKMNGLRASVAEARAIAAGAANLSAAVDLAICPPATLISMVGDELAGGVVALGGQDCHWEASGAFTGDVSAAMLADLGVRYVIVGHSERRGEHGETDRTVSVKAEAAIAAGLAPIICLGESLEERDSGRTIKVIAAQLRGSVPEVAASGGFVVAYEPIWAIGTGRTPSSAQIAEAHAALRQGLQERFGAVAEGVRLLYGGSVKPDNAAELMHIANVDGALVGGASLKAKDFLAIASACR